MSIVPILLGLAIEIGVPVVKQILEGKVDNGGQLVEVVVKTVAESAGVPVDDLQDLAEKNPALVREALVVAEGIAPELVGLYTTGLNGQFALLSQEGKEGPWQSGWRWGWMYLLGFMWFVRLMVVPVVDALLDTDIGAGMELQVMLTLTGWFIGLYMGGHTLKEIGKNVIDAVRTTKGRA